MRERFANSRSWGLRRGQPRANPLGRAPSRRGVSRSLCLWAIVFVVILGAWIGRVGARNTPPSEGRLEQTWGDRGLEDGRLQKPRAAAVDSHDRIHLVDMSARLQVFDRNGKLLRPPVRTPEFRYGKPTGLSIGPDDHLLVADTHYARVLVYSPEGELLPERTIGGTRGQGPGEFGLVTDAVVDSAGNVYVAERGDLDRIQKFSPQGEFLRQWGSHGDGPGQFRRPQNLAIDEQDRIWVVDACNHRIQVFDGEGELLQMWGSYGTDLGRLSYPYDLVVTDEAVYVCEFGNHRVQKFTHDGVSLGVWGEAGHGNDQLHNPWALVRDSRQRLYVIDTNHHRVHRVHF
ncbi:MAG: hypothetical protein DWQ31_15380 [Planctomycetota bacterium]|nr:MAG: hypothetical protein DWQ31_15380 [Planctomycetota bacterium]REJ87434.1 MAG: hypothetical protein DWQ35_21495 [Planctomycetota bacterium]REK30774.1 MAG: hypothetical protein DWQ42_01425 [Planctomycetota bacterium]REK42154.1 MAG: hypothetical protein DWQ46_14305 [Planctomycetota bacterium]